MDEANYLEAIKRIEALEARIARMEKRALFQAPGGVTGGDLNKAYPLMMNKTQAANALGVTRATIYAMIEDGRLAENGLGKVVTQSVIDLIERGTPPRQRKGAAAN